MIIDDKISLFKEQAFPSKEDMSFGFKDSASLPESIKVNEENQSFEKLQQSFSSTFEKALDKVNDLQKAADRKIEDFSTGKNKNIPEVMIAIERADIALKLMVKVRNKIVEAYQEVMRMQV